MLMIVAVIMVVLVTVVMGMTVTVIVVVLVTVVMGMTVTVIVVMLVIVAVIVRMIVPFDIDIKLGRADPTPIDSANPECKPA
jgi:hypothetical protein